jgi:hypothetical protein
MQYDFLAVNTGTSELRIQVFLSNFDASGPTEPNGGCTVEYLAA